jgi:hypothetical protein
VERLVGRMYVIFVLFGFWSVFGKSEVFGVLVILGKLVFLVILMIYDISCYYISGKIGGKDLWYFRLFSLFWGQTVFRCYFGSESIILGVLGILLFYGLSTRTFKGCLNGVFGVLLVFMVLVIVGWFIYFIETPL